MKIKFTTFCLLTSLMNVARADTSDPELMRRCADRYRNFEEQFATVRQSWEHHTLYGPVFCNYICDRDLFYVRECHQPSGGRLDGGNDGRR